MILQEPRQYILKDNGIFPNSHLPVLHYIQAIELPRLFPAVRIRKIFRQHGWSNNWRNGIYTYSHYHSITHEVLGVAKGATTLLLGGEDGIKIDIRKGDVIVIPAGVAHKNLCKEKDVICVGGYPHGRDFDINYGRAEERPQTDLNIAKLPLPDTDPLYGKNGPLIHTWK